ncbi:hypothetical protein EDD17DRAFT_1765651 [Pisolithus thermaeus]|nr:hypothetical protein EDD17DRAFT_1765651 [Pisolithus thermaeus]
MTRQRPSSAIYIGSSSSSSLQLQYPPPSPGSNTSGGLPSPPATNSTGSGSTTEDNGVGSTHQCPAPNVIMDHHHNDKLTLSDDDDDNDDDNTARLDRRHPSKNTGEVSGTLQRVKSLAQRNRMAIDKLTSFSRLNTPSPSSSSRLSRSPGCNPLASASTSSLTSMSHPSRPASTSASDRRRADTLSGSETERESFRASTPSHSHSFRSTSPELSTSPPLPPLPPSTSPSHEDDNASRPRQHRMSAPSSPDKACRSAPGPSRTPRKRASLASTTSAPVGPLDADRERYKYHAHERGYANENDITNAALAAVASARQSPTDTATASTSSRRSRQPLPREFRDGGRQSLDGRTSIEPPRTPYRTPVRDGSRDRDENADISPRTALHTAANASMTRLQFSPSSASRPNRTSTVRDGDRWHQPRWQSDDISTNGTGNMPSISSNFTSTVTAATATGATVSGTGRRQTLRGGSAESPLASGRLASESLRAAGIGTRGVRSPFLAGSASSATNGSSANDKDDDPFSGTDAGASYRSRSRIGKSVEWDDREHDRHQDYQDHYGHDRDTQRHMLPDDQRSRTSASSIRVSEGVGPSSLSSSRLGIGSLRPATSMATTGEWNEGLREGMVSRNDFTELRSRGEFERSRSATLRRHMSVVTPSHPYTHSSPYSRLDQHQQQAEHARLLAESLTMFYATLSKLPIQTGVGRELGYQAETIVRASERLNGLLRAGTAHAVQRQIAIEVEEDGGHELRRDEERHVRDSSREGRDAAKLWRDIGADFREGLRESDEVVRTLTGFILGVGKVLKEMASIASASTSGGGGSAASATSGAGSACGSTTGEGKEHLRSVSLDHHDIVRRYVRTPDGGGGGRLIDGRRSVESRRSWDPIGVSGATSSSLDLSRRISSVHRDREHEPALSRPPSSAMREREKDGGGSDQDRRGGPRTRMTPPLPLPEPPPAPASASSSTLESTSSAGPGLPSTTRRLMTPREIREQQSASSARAPDTGVVNLSSADYEPSPTPVSRQQFGKGMPPPLLSHSSPGFLHFKEQLTSGGRPPSHGTVARSTPPPLPTLPSESFLRKSSLAGKQNRRKVSLASIASIMTIRASGSGSGGSGASQAPPFAVTSSGPTTAVTAHTVLASSPESLTPISTLPPSNATSLTRTDSKDSRESGRSGVTFSRPSEVSTSALQTQRSRNEARRPGEEELIREREKEIRQSLKSPLSGSETERDTRRRTIGSRVARMSLDAAIDEREGEFVGRSGGVGPGGTQTNTIALPSQRRERRRTVTEIFGRA